MLAHQTYQPRISVPTLASAAKPFGGYKPETDRTQDARPVQAIVLPDLKYLRQLRDELKQMPPEVVLEMMEFHRGLDMFQALDLAKRTGKLLVPNIVHDQILNRTNASYNSWTGTMIIYEAPDQPFGFQVSSNRVLFKVPDQFLGMRNCALVVEHPDFDLVKKKDGKYELVVPDLDMLHLVENFPKAKGWYPHPANQFGISQEINQTDGEHRQLWRSDYEYLGILSRGCASLLYVRLGIYLCDESSTDVGVALIG